MPKCCANCLIPDHILDPVVPYICPHCSRSVHFVCLGGSQVDENACPSLSNSPCMDCFLTIQSDLLQFFPLEPPVDGIIPTKPPAIKRKQLPMKEKPKRKPDPSTKPPSFFTPKKKKSPVKKKKAITQPSVPTDDPISNHPEAQSSVIDLLNETISDSGSDRSVDIDPPFDTDITHEELAQSIAPSNDLPEFFPSDIDEIQNLIDVSLADCCFFLCLSTHMKFFLYVFLLSWP